MMTDRRDATGSDRTAAGGPGAWRCMVASGRRSPRRRPPHSADLSRRRRPGHDPRRRSRRQGTAGDDAGERRVRAVRQRHAAKPILAVEQDNGPIGRGAAVRHQRQHGRQRPVRQGARAGLLPAQRPAQRRRRSGDLRVRLAAARDSAVHHGAGSAAGHGDRVQPLGHDVDSRRHRERAAGRWTRERPDGVRWSC